MTLQLARDSLSFLFDNTPILLWIATMAVLLPFEVWFPLEKQKAVKARVLNIIISAFFFLSLSVCNYFSMFAVSAIQDNYAPLGTEIVDLLNGMWWGSYLHAAIFFLLLDLSYYVWHLSQHKVPWLWHLHLVHHSDTSMNSTTALRHHFSEPIFQTTVINVPVLIIVGLPPVDLSVLANVLTIWVWFSHANVKIPCTFLDEVVSTPAAHRIHHSTRPEHFDKNFGSYTLLWDRLFGTLCRADGKDVPNTGVASYNLTTSREALIPPKP